MAPCRLLDLPDNCLQSIWEHLGERGHPNHAAHALHCTCRDMRMLTRFVRRMLLLCKPANMDEVAGELRAFPKHATLQHLDLCYDAKSVNLADLLSTCLAACDGALIQRRLASVQCLRLLVGSPAMVTSGDVFAASSCMPSLKALHLGQEEPPAAVSAKAIVALRCLPGLASLTLHIEPLGDVVGSLAHLPPSLTTLDLRLTCEEPYGDVTSLERLLLKLSGLTRLQSLTVHCNDDDEGFDGERDTASGAIDKFAGLAGLRDLRSLTWTTSQDCTNAVSNFATLASLTRLTELHMRSAVAQDGAAEALLSLPLLQRLSVGRLLLRLRAEAVCALAAMAGDGSGAEADIAAPGLTRLPPQLHVGEVITADLLQLPLRLVDSFACNHVACVFPWFGSTREGASPRDAKAAANSLTAAAAWLPFVAEALRAGRWAGTLMTVGWDAPPTTPTPALLGALGQPGTRHIAGLMLERMVLDEESLEQLAAALPCLRGLWLCECKVQGRPWRALHRLKRLERLCVRSSKTAVDVKEVAIFCVGAGVRLGVQATRGLYAEEEQALARQIMANATGVAVDWVERAGHEGDGHWAVDMFDWWSRHWWRYLCPTCKWTVNWDHVCMDCDI